MTEDVFNKLAKQINGLIEKEVEHHIHPDIQTAIKLFNIVCMLNAINDSEQASNEIDEALVRLQIDALSTAKLSLRHARVPIEEHIAVELFVELKMGYKI